MPPRAVDSARSQRRKTRYDLVPAGGSPHGARSSLVITKLPLWKIRVRAVDSLYFIFFSSIGVVIHRRPSLPRSSCRRPVSCSPFSLSVIAKSATHYLILPPGNRFPLFLFLFLRAERPSYSPCVFIPGRFALLSATAPRDRPRLAQVTTIGNFNARPVLPNDFIQWNGCRVAEWRPRSMPKLGIDTPHSFTFASPTLLLSPTNHSTL